MVGALVVLHRREVGAVLAVAKADDGELLPDELLLDDQFVAVLLEQLAASSRAVNSFTSRSNETFISSLSIFFPGAPDGPFGPAGPAGPRKFFAFSILSFVK